MQDTDIVLGNKYKLDIPNSTGWYVVIAKSEENGQIVYTLKGKEAHHRYAPIEKFLDNTKTSYSSKRKVEHRNLQLVGELKGKPCYEVDIDYYPQEKRRGRKPNGN